MELFIVFPAFGHCLPVINFIECQAKLNRNVVYHFVTSKVMIEGLKRRNLVAGLESRLVLIGLEDGLESAEELATESTFTNMELPLLTYLEEALEDTSCRKVVVEMFACRILTEKAWSTIIKFTDKISLFFPSPVSCAYHMCCFEQRIHPENGQRLGENVNVENIYPHSTRPQIIAACVAFAKAARELKDCCVLINSFAEIEQEWVHKIHSLEAFKNVDIKLVGPTNLLKEQRRTSVQTANDHKVAAFLDAHVSFGVVYVSMGSIGNLTPDQIVEMYNGLLECGFPFIWSLRQGQTEHLPSSSTIQVQKFDFLIIPWTNQQEILSHRATRVFITHCGWNSSIEALSCGVPVVTWPLFAEQSLNASLFHKLGVGVPLEGTFYNKDRRVVPRSEISAAIKECVSSNLFKTAQQFKQICIKASQRAAQQEHF